MLRAATVTVICITTSDKKNIYAVMLAVITGPHALNAQYYEILPTTSDYQRAIQVQLVATS